MGDDFKTRSMKNNVYSHLIFDFVFHLIQDLNVNLSILIQLDFENTNFEHLILMGPPHWKI